MRPETYFKGTMHFKKDGEALVSGGDYGISYRLRHNINGQQIIDGEITEFHVVIRNLQASKRFEDKLDLYKIAKHETYNRQAAWFHNENNPSVELVLTADGYAPNVDKFNLTGDAISALGVDLENLPSDIDLFVTIEQYLTPLEKLGKNYADENAAGTMAPIAGSLGGSGNIADRVVGYDKNLVDRFAKKVVLCHLEPPFENGEEDNRTQAYQALKNFIESEVNDPWADTPISHIGVDLPMTQAASYLFQLRTNLDLPSSEKAAYMAFCNMLPKYGIMFEMTDGRKFDISPAIYRISHKSSYSASTTNLRGNVNLINEPISETEFSGEIWLHFIDEDWNTVSIMAYHTCVFDVNVDKWRIKEMEDDEAIRIYNNFGDRIKSVDIYVIQ